ncbi:MAG: rhomboid family intramembrane serine protease [Planctomycetota bacterium]
MMDEAGVTAGLTPPWCRADGLPEVPADEPFGYMQGGRLKPCSAEKLHEVVSSSQVATVTFVWTPETEGLEPAAWVPSLAGPVRRCQRQELTVGLLNGLCLVGFGWMSWGIGSLGQGDAAGWLAGVFVLVGLIALGQAVWSWKRPADATPSEDGLLRFRFAAWLTARPNRYTLALMVCAFAPSLVAVFAGLEEAVDAAGLVRAEVAGGEWWRLLTYGSLHGGAMHGVMNAAVLFAVGGLVEALLGWKRLVAVYVGGVVVGGLATWWWPVSDLPTVGASAGVLSLVGALLVVGVRWRAWLPRRFAWSWVAVVVLTGGVGAVLPGMIDNVAHGGGLMAGLVMGWVLTPRDAARGPREPAWPVGLIALTCLLAQVGAAVWVLWRVLLR